jgi:hypothetical protein
MAHQDHAGEGDCPGHDGGWHQNHNVASGVASNSANDRSDALLPSTFAHQLRLTEGASRLRVVFACICCSDYLYVRWERMVLARRSTTTAVRYRYDSR